MTIPLRPLLSCGVAGLFLVVAPASLEAQTPDFTFQIPVQLADVSEAVTHVKAGCAVMETNDPPPFVYGDSDIVPMPADGALSHTFTVEMTVGNREFLSAVPSMDWVCWIEVKTDQHNWHELGENIPHQNLPHATSRSGTQRIVKARGTLTPGP